MIFIRRIAGPRHRSPTEVWTLWHLGRSEPLTSELCSDFMMESFVDRYLPGVLVFLFVRVEPKEKERVSYASRGVCPHNWSAGKLSREVKYCIVQDGVRDISWRTRRFAMRIDPSVVLCVCCLERWGLFLCPSVLFLFCQPAPWFFCFEVHDDVDSTLRRFGLHANYIY